MDIKFIFFLLILLITQNLYAQTFNEAAGIPFEGVSASSIAFADIDVDNDQDVLITGGNDSSIISKLYTNNGQGNFNEVSGAPFEDVVYGSIAFADVDGDNDQDVLLTGDTLNDDPITKLYTNDGQGNFSVTAGTSFDNVHQSSIAFADVDGDNDQDVLLTGVNNSLDKIAKLYTNDGQGNFSEVMGTPFEGVNASSIAFADVDGDNDQDVLITGFGSSGSISALYANDGQGNFSEVVGIPFEDVGISSIAFADIDGDNDQDVLLTGKNNSAEHVSKLYINDGQGNYSEATGTPFEGVNESSIAFADVDGDNDQDVLITGDTLANTSWDPFSELYINNGQGNFSEATGTPFENILGGHIAFADVDKDNDQDLLLTGYNNPDYVTKLYINDGQGNFSEVTGTSFDNPAANASFKGIDVLPYPNPIKGKHLHVRYNSPENGDVQVKVYGMKGDLVKQQKEFTGTRQQSLSIDLPSLAQGSYILELQQGKRKGYARFTVH